MLTRKKIGVLLGGTSAERDVSLRSGASIFNALRGLGYNVVKVDVGPNVCEVLGKEKIELAFLALHGGTGEDGSMQGLLEVMGIPYTGSGVLASALAMDKLVSKTVFASAGLDVPRYEVLRRGEGPSIEMPFVIKPVREGSSIGVSIVKEPAGLEGALEAALSFTGTAIVEEFIDAKEIHIGVFRGRAMGGVEVRPTLEFYNYEAKYTSGLTEYVLPPEIDDALYERCKAVALRAHEALGARGATRVDLLVDANDRIYVLEVNTIPGMTETSLLPKIASLEGLSFQGLVEEILREALEEEGGRVGG